MLRIIIIIHLKATVWLLGSEPSVTFHSGVPMSQNLAIMVMVVEVVIVVVLMVAMVMVVVVMAVMLVIAVILVIVMVVTVTVIAVIVVIFGDSDGCDGDDDCNSNVTSIRTLSPSTTSYLMDVLSNSGGSGQS